MPDDVERDVVQYSINGRERAGEIDVNFNRGILFTSDLWEKSEAAPVKRLPTIDEDPAGEAAAEKEDTQPAGGGRRQRKREKDREKRRRQLTQQ